ncbi:hypothetical protein EI42_05433 [Thermosporothrix hazakensis]|jgi:hypothetical protein|uniref:Uncharacterized protein n=1 Tax=Thermosporothrix hazakensis TaxID=644383 RepID=A0A326U011_THEHA|nr:hypothetical protein EI42_05433 [Thermosporothrix hazakensis]
MVGASFCASQQDRENQAITADIVKGEGGKSIVPQGNRFVSQPCSTHPCIHFCRQLAPVLAPVERHFQTRNILTPFPDQEANTA